MSLAGLMETITFTLLTLRTLEEFAVANVIAEHPEYSMLVEEPNLNVLEKFVDVEPVQCFTHRNQVEFLVFRHDFMDV